MQTPQWTKPFVFLLVLLAALIPVVLYLWVFSGVSVLSAEDALTMLNDPSQNAILVDVRSQEEFSEMYIPGSRHWPVGEIVSLQNLSQIPADLAGRKLLLICNSGIQSSQAAASLGALGAGDVYVVKGGIQKWIGTDVALSAGDSSSVKPMTLVEQVSAVVSGFGFKPLHMLLSAVLGFVLVRQKAFDVRTFGWGILIFLAAETACAVNYIFYNHDSYLAEYLHSFGMALSFSVAAFAVLHGLDERLLKFSAPDKHCAFLPLCRGCVKHNLPSCSLRKLFQLGAAALALLAFIPLLAQPLTEGYRTQIFGTPYHYCRLLLNQYFENRYLPLLVILLSAGTLFALQRDKSVPAPFVARVLMSGALGGLGFSMFRLMLGSIYSSDLIWADFWEEATELMFVAFSAIVVWIFRQGLLDVPIREVFRRDVPSSDTR